MRKYMQESIIGILHDRHLQNLRLEYIFVHSTNLSKSKDMAMSYHQSSAGYV